VDLVLRGTLPGQGLRQVLRQSELGDLPAGRIAVDAQQAARLVVGELHAPLAVHQQQALADGMQDGVVVVDHPREPGR
jgi:hypothetical protein